jgi:hypothetical protein
MRIFKNIFANAFRKSLAHRISVVNESQLPASSGISEARRISELVSKGELNLEEGLIQLRKAASSVRPHGKLLEWGRNALDVSRAEEGEWFERAIWGIWAEEIFVDAVHSINLIDQAMQIIDGPPSQAVDRIAKRSTGLILSCAHLGPSQACLAWILHQHWPLLAWTRSKGFSQHHDLVSGAQILYAGNGSENLAAAFIHLRRGGVFFAAVDALPHANFVTCRRFKGEWRCATATPVLARQLSIPVECIVATWKGNRININCMTLPPPDANLDADEWNRRWIESFWCSVDGKVQNSPENLRILLLSQDNFIKGEVGL